MTRPARSIPFNEQYLRARRRATEERERIALILRGPAFGTPLFVPKHLWPCSLCVTLKNRNQFHLPTDNPRIEPVCDECWGKLTPPQQAEYLRAHKNVPKRTKERKKKWRNSPARRRMRLLRWTRQVIAYAQRADPTT
jgi:hypothetical protein